MGARGGCARGEGWGQGDRHTCWRGRACLCWAAASALDFALLFLPVSPPPSLPGPLLPSLLLLRDGCRCQLVSGAPEQDTGSAGLGCWGPLVGTSGGRGFW